MVRFGSVLCMLLLLLLQPAGTSAFQEQKVPENELPRFHKVNDTLYRGGMPDGDGFALLKDMGIKTVINFRNEDDERALVEKLAMNYVHIPLTASRGISDYSIQEFFKVVKNPENHPVFVHCQRGADRTGAMMAFYRIAFEKWDPERAYREARDIGLRWWYLRLRKQIRAFDPADFAELSPSRTN